MKKRLLISVSLILVAGLGIFGYAKRDAIRARFFSDQPPALPDAVETQITTIDVANEDPIAEADANLAATVKLPQEYNLSVPFVRQAPTNNWDATHEELCEEAAALTVHYFWAKKRKFTSTEVEAQYKKMIAYENKKFGDFKDTTAKQTAQMIKDLYGYKRVDVLPMKSLDDAKRHVLAGRPVLIPSAGKLLKNPNFKNGGPLYHNLVIRGWLKDGRIITNDPGTRKGEGYVYKASTLWNAIHDWNGGKVTTGAKVMIVVYPNR